MYFVDPSARVFWLYLLVALAIVWLMRHRLGNTLSRYFTLNVWWHPSARLDYLLFVLMWGIKLLLILPLFTVASDLAVWLYSQMINSFGYMQRIMLPATTLALIYAITLFLLNDFSRYWLHRWMHRVPWLWKIHQVHHSAEVLTPLTFYRVHPLENVLFGVRYIIVALSVTVMFWYLFGFSLGSVTLFGINVFVLFFNVIGSNLRHTHLPIHYGRFNALFCAPLAHQMHHTSAYQQKNFGAYLFIWDIMFHTAAMPKRHSHTVRYGLETIKIHSIVALIWHPFMKGNR